MENEAPRVPSFLAETSQLIGSWVMSVRLDLLAWCLIGVFLVFVLRKPIARLILASVQALLQPFSVTLSDSVASQLRTATEILLVTLAVYVAETVLLPDGVAKVFIDKALSSVAIVVVFGVWYQLGGTFVSLLRSEKTKLMPTETDWMQRIAQFAILLFGLTSLLKVWEVDITGALTGVGVLGAGLAIATQDLIRNFVAGVTNISEKRFETGDSIQVDGKFVGTVEKIDLRSTLVVGFDQIPRHIPNSDLSNSVVLNYSAIKHRRVLLKVPLVLSSTQTQIEAVRDGLRDHHRNSGDFELGDDAPQHIYVSGLGPSSVDILIYAWTKCPDYAGFLQVSERLTLAIMEITHKAGTELAYPTQTVKLDANAMPSGPVAGSFDAKP